ncbi:putative Dynein associated protein domain-containing protein [Seiridium unicorne]|uniref:Dynein associated protein domain-containing protein n=1 Tax=Seiridium unicorne TaxID=138068 RepID=A0ABR2UH23_9PEZI
MASQPDVAQMFETFSKLVQTLAQDQSFQHVKDYVSLNNELSNTNAELTSTNQGNWKNIALLENKVQATEKAAEESRSDLRARQAEVQALSEEHKKISEQVVTLKRQLKENDALMSENQKKANKNQDVITQLGQKMEREAAKYESAEIAQKDLQLRLGKLQEQFNTVQSSLDSYTALADGVAKVSRETIASSVATLDGIASSMRILIVSYVSVELKPEALAAICNGRHNRLAIPLLGSNTHDARHMRIAVALNVAAEALEKYIFQATYLLEGNGFCRILADLAEDDPVREAHIRAVLLPVKVQRRFVKQRIQQCVEEIESFLDPMVLENEKAGFSAALNETCTQICKDWAGLQALKGRIEVRFDPDDADRWNLLSGFIEEDLRKMQQSSGSGTSSSEGQDKAKKGLQSVDFDQVAHVVWPTFIWRTAAGRNILQNCVVISLDQVARARSEQGSHRGKRMAHRESVSAANGEGSKKGKSFLPGSSAGNRDGG